MNSSLETLRLSEHADCRILVCDDSHDDAHLLSGTLKAIGYAAVIMLTDPRQALSQVMTGQFDLLVLDIKMPHLGGSDMISAVRGRFSAVELPILVVTDMESKETRNTALSAGANDYLNKPVDRAELALRVRNLTSLRAIHVAHRKLNQQLEREVKSRTAKLNILIDNGLLMSATRDVSKLFRHTLFEGQRLLNCDGGSLYLVTKNKSLRFAMRTRADALPTNEIPFVDAVTGRTNDHYMAVYAALHRKSVLVDDVYSETRFDVSGTKQFDALSHYRTVSLVTVPIASRGGGVTGVLQFINKIDAATGKFVPFPPDQVTLIEALAAHAAVTFENIQLIDERKSFMESLIHTIATAIDAKSPYTGRHSERVPELAIMLAEAANAAKTGSLADFSFKNDDEWHEFRVGAWLHDCGKITTPEHVIDKATKLETIYNRIHEIRMRFEVLLRDAQIECLTQSQGASESEHAAALAALAARRAELQSDFLFVAQCNMGSETMSAEHIDRLGRIANLRWERHFDDRLGLSDDETYRRRNQAVQFLPASEPLLADQPHHLIPRGLRDQLDPQFGFQVDVPEHLYNLGELHNLTVRRGTLTEEDRYKINEHMIHGIKMLERMPFPDSLKRVPEYAGTHHETLLGTGYPRRLAGNRLSVPARIMAIADIFEALTASDRPYKAPQKFSQALAILHGMKVAGQIDAELFDLFLTSGVHLRYAKKFLLPEQIDVLDIKPFLGPVPA